MTNRHIIMIAQFDDRLANRAAHHSLRKIPVREVCQAFAIKG